jgi:hypothetical protein
MNNDKKTTLIGFIQAALIAGLAAFSYFTGFDATDLTGNVSTSGDWGTLILVLFSIFTAIKGYFTNKETK